MYLNKITIVVSAAIVIFQILLWFFRNKAYKGIKYALYHYYILFKLRKSFLDAGYYNTRLYFDNEIAELPKIKLDFNPDFSKAKLLIQNINIGKDLGNVNISFALDNFVIDQSYLSNDENFYVFEIYNSKISNQLIFDDFKSFKEHSYTSDRYSYLSIIRHQFLYTAPC
ncbi:hypothetical protein [Mammaliicoccus vitulinus]|uniref:hypothetical protein n=1 Tax=Mammaliicoccus vitulinus TaxID=71237 RepID=UPI00248C3F88|nr:hypothetical protein [Mammaliicoccus vitulinus]